jgi:hypothetical protein
MIKYEYGYQAYVSGDGNYGVDSVITFDYDYFHEEFPKVWAILDEIHDSSRFDFILAVLDQDEDTLTELAEENDFRLSDVLKP